MVYQGLLIAIFVAFFIPTFWYILRRDDVFGIAYLFLFVYTIFTQIGYAFFPYLSARKNVFYGERMFYDYWLFVFLSFCLSFSIYALVTSRYLKRRRGWQVVALPLHSKHIFGTIWLLVTVYLTAEFVSINAQLHYSMTEQQLTGRTFIFVSILRCYELILVVMYARWRVFAVKGRGRRRVQFLAIAVSCVITAVIAARIGSRADILYVAVALIALELSPLAETLKRRWRRIVAIVPVVVLLLYGLSVLETVRIRYAKVDSAALLEVAADPALALGLNDTGAEGLLARDFYWPSHLLMTAMYYQSIDPGEVLASNLANCAVGLKYPTLQQTTTRRIGGGFSGVSRVAGFAFYQYVEGYLAMGWFGVVYNAVLWNVGLLCWRALVQTRDGLLNRAILGVIVYFVPNLMRSQSAAYVNWAVFWLLPAVALLCLATNRMPGRRHRTGELLAPNTVPMPTSGMEPC